jgi:hypothetical protein
MLYSDAQTVPSFTLGNQGIGNTQRLSMFPAAPQPGSMFLSGYDLPPNVENDRIQEKISVTGIRVAGLLLEVLP